MRYSVVLEPAEEGGFVVECPALPGCISEGDTREEALINIKDAIEGYIASLRKHGDPIPQEPVEKGSRKLNGTRQNLTTAIVEVAA